MQNNVRIGVTERGDGGLDLSWKDKCTAGAIDGVIVITKRLTDACISAILGLYQKNFPVVLHLGTTGWGGSPIEPGTWDYKTQIAQAHKLIAHGFPKNHITLRVDPIFPTRKGIDRACDVIRYSLDTGLLPEARIRISVLDEYPHVRERFRKMGYEPIYHGRFTCSDEEFRMVEHHLSQFGLPIETCAEPKLTSSTFRRIGCVSKRDLELMGLPIPDTSRINNQNRGGCLCLAAKTELLTQRHPCANNCQYCYWKDR